MILLYNNLNLLGIDNNFRAFMTTNVADYDQNQQSLQFYKIKLMEKQREISNHTAQLKKIQFKNNRDLKELKMAQEKAKNALNLQKQKVDKINKTITEVTEQNNVLQHRLNQLKQEKDKQIQTTRAQYNHLKTQVRSYERILPTHTFMTKFSFNYEKLPTYEDIFMNLKERSDRFDELEEKFKKYKAQAEEKIDMQLKVNESLQKKKAEVQKQLREDIHKLLDLQSQITTIASERDELRNSMSDLTQQVISGNQMNDQLTEQIKSLDAKIQQILTVCTAQLETKDEQHRRMMEEEIRKHEDEVERITRDYQMRQNSHLQQLAYFQEEEHRISEQKQKDKERFQQYEREVHFEIERIKAELETEKQEVWRITSQYEKTKQELRAKDNECLSYLQKIGEYEFRVQQLISQVRKLQDKIASNKDESNQKYGSVMEEKNELLLKIKQLQDELDESREECLNRQNQIRMLFNQVEELKHKGTTMSKSNYLSISNGMDFDQASPIRNRSNTQENSQFEKSSIRQNLNPTRNRQDSQISNRSERKKSAVFYSQQQLQAKLAETIKEAEKQFQTKMEKTLLETKTALQSQLKQKFSQDMNEVVKEQKKQVNELKKRQEDFQNKLKKIYEQHEMEKFQLNETVNKLNKKFQLLRLQKEALQQNYIQHINEAKRDKQGLNAFKNQNRELQKTIKQHTKNIENMNIQLEILKKFKERAQAREMKEKSVSSESSTNNIKDIVEKYTSQITKLIHQKEQQIKLKEQLEEELNTIKRQIVSKNDEIDSLKTQLEEKHRENQMLDGLLDHERKDRTLRTVPSLASLPDQDEQEEQNFKQFYNQAGQKQGQILILEREVHDLKNEIEEIKQKYDHKIAGLEEEMNGYIQQIIEMKLKVANSEMKASEKTYLYNQLKKKMNVK